MASDRRQLRLILPPGINYAMHQLALREGRSDSAMATRLIGEAIDARNVAAQTQPEDIKRLMTILSAAAKTSLREPAASK
jgi:hypothetical protein